MPSISRGQDIFQGAQLKQDITSVTLVNTTAKTIDVEVPTGKRWILSSIRATNPDDQTRTIDFKKYKESAKTNIVKAYESKSKAAGGRLTWPAHEDSTTEQVKPSSPAEFLVAGNVIEINWSDPGASSGGTDADGLAVEYLEA